MTPSIRPESPADHEAIRQVNRLAFGQDDEAVLVDALCAGGHAAALSSRGDRRRRGGPRPLQRFANPHRSRRGARARRLRPWRFVPTIRNGESAPRSSARVWRPLGRPGIASSSSWAMPSTTPASGSPRSWPNTSRRRSPVGIRGWLWSWSRALDGVEGAVQYAPPFGIEPPARKPLRIQLLAEIYAVCKLPSSAAIPPWASGGTLVSITRTEDELSVVCRAEDVPEGVACERSCAACASRARCRSVSWEWWRR